MQAFSPCEDFVESIFNLIIHIPLSLLCERLEISDWSDFGHKQAKENKFCQLVADTQ